MFKKMKERLAAAADAYEQQLAAAMEPGESLIAYVMASSAASKQHGGSDFARVRKAVTNLISESRYVDGPSGSVARRFPDDNPMTHLVVSDRRLRLLALGYAGIGKPMTMGAELLRVERHEITGVATVADDLTKVVFADGSWIVLRWGGAATPLPTALARMGVPTVVA